MDMQIIKKFLEDKNSLTNGGSVKYMDISFEIMPMDFINYAKEDLKTNLQHKYINALSNTKRALDCQADRLLKLFGYYDESKRKGKLWGFSAKVELIEKFDIIAPEILKKVNRYRNTMEHHYIKPDSNQVNDFWEIVYLFIRSTEHITSNSLPCVQYENYYSEEFPVIGELELTTDNENGKIIINTDNRYNSKMNQKIEVTKSDPEYIEIFKRHLKKIDFR